ncbi:MAG: trimeric intracellular cation channel family protein [Motiliproteus sp.]
MQTLDLSQLVSWLGLFGIAVFAISGALEAARKEMDILGFMLIGSVTGLGGGTLRDLLLGRSPVYWVEQPVYVAVSLSAAVITYFLVPVIVSRLKALIWMDALGLALFSVTGTKIAIDAGASPLIAICMGVMTASFGGIIRDVLCGESLVLRQRELYVTATVVGSLGYLSLKWFLLPDSVALIGGLFAAFSLRSAAIVFGLCLPVYRAPD